MRILNLLKDRLSLSTNKIKVVKNLYWSVLGKIVNILSGLFVGILVARYLGPSDYGLMSYVISFITLFNILATFGFDNIEIRELAKENFLKNEVLGTAFFLRLSLAIITYLIVLSAAFFYESNFDTVFLVSIYALSYFFSSFNIIRNYFTSIVLNEYVVKSEILRVIVGGGIKVLLVFCDASLTWFIWSLVFDFFLISLGYIISYKKIGKKLSNWSFSREVAKYQLKNSLPLVFSGAAILIYQKIDQLMIMNMLDSSALGQYSVGAKLSEFSIFIPLVISQTISPILVRIKLQNQEEYEKKRQFFFDVIFWSTFLMCLLMSLLAKPVILLLYGTAYLDAIVIFQIMSWKSLFAAMFTSSAQIIVIENIQKYAVMRNIIGCIVNILLNYWLIPIIGILGASIVSVFTMLITGYLSHLIVKPYRFIFLLQSDSIFKGAFRIIDMLKLTLIKIKNV